MEQQRGIDQITFFTSILLNQQCTGTSSFAHGKSYLVLGKQNKPYVCDCVPCSPCRTLLLYCFRLLNKARLERVRFNRTTNAEHMTHVLTIFRLISGVPYPAEFDIPFGWTETTYSLSWRVNSTAPIINYQLQFREFPHGPWIVINIPAEIININANPQMLSPGLTEYYNQSYTIKGLSEGSHYQVSSTIIFLINHSFYWHMAQYQSN